MGQSDGSTVYEIEPPDQAQTKYEIEPPEKTAPQTFSQRHPYIAKVGETLGDVATGAGKSLASTPYNLAGAVNTGLRAVLPYGDKYIPAPPVAPKGLEETNTAQKVGGGLEQAAEMTLAGGPLREGAEAFSAATKIPAAAARIAAESANAGGNAILHGQQPGPSAAIGAGAATLGEAVSAAAPVVKRAAENQYQKFLSPTKQTTKNMTDKIVPELLERRQLALSGQGLENKAAQQTETLGGKINDAVSKVPTTVKPDTATVVKSLEKYKQGFIVNGVAVDEAAVKNVEKLQDTITQLGPNVSYQSLNKVRHILDKGVARSGGYAGKTIAEGTALDAQKEAANAIRRELSRQSPDIAKINGEFHFWSQVGDVIGATNQRRVGQQGGLTRVIAPIAGAAAGLALGGLTPMGGLDAAAASTIMLATSEVIRSPAWRTTSAVMKNELADAMASGSVAEVAKIAGRIAAGTYAQSKGNNPSRR